VLALLVASVRLVGEYFAVSYYIEPARQVPIESVMYRIRNAPCHRVLPAATGDSRQGARCSATAATVCILVLICLSGCATLVRNKTDQTVVSARQLSLRGIHAMQQGQLREAEVFFSRASEICPLDERIRFHYAETLWDLGSRPQAVTHMEEAVRLSGGNAELVVRLGDMYLAEGDLQRAALQAESAIQSNRHLAAAWALRGSVLQQMGRDDDALADYHRALSLQAHYPRAQLASAEIYARQKRHARALATLRTLADGYPSGETPQQVLVLQGVALKELGRYDAAIEVLAAAAKQGPPSTEVLVQLAETQWLAGDAANARLTLQTALARTSHESGTEPLMAQVLTLQRKLAGDVRL
jgi:tetratricopeptide (TPR) repeat protein